MANQRGLTGVPGGRTRLLAAQSWDLLERRYQLSRGLVDCGGKAFWKTNQG